MGLIALEVVEEEVPLEVLLLLVVKVVPVS